MLFHAMSAPKPSYRAESAVLCMSPIVCTLWKDDCQQADHCAVRGRAAFQLPYTIDCRYPEKSIRQYDKKVQAIIGQHSARMNTIVAVHFTSRFIYVCSALIESVSMKLFHDKSFK